MPARQALFNSDAQVHRRGQVFDIPAVRFEVVQDQALRLRCPSGKLHESEPKWGLSGLRYEASVVAGSVRRLWCSQRCGIRPWMQLPIYGLNPYLGQQVSAFVRPAHLTFFGHAPADHFVHRRLGDRAANRQPLVVPTLVIHQVPMGWTLPPQPASKCAKVEFHSNHLNR